MKSVYDLYNLNTRLRDVLVAVSGTSLCCCSEVLRHHNARLDLSLHGESGVHTYIQHLDTHPATGLAGRATWKAAVHMFQRHRYSDLVALIQDSKTASDGCLPMSPTCQPSRRFAPSSARHAHLTSHPSLTYPFRCTGPLPHFPHPTPCHMHTPT